MARRILLLVRDRSIYADDLEQTIRTLVDAFARHGAETEVQRIGLDAGQVRAVADRAGAFDRVLCRITLEDQPIEPVHALLEALEAAGASYFPRLADARTLGSKTAVHALRDTAIGLPDTALADTAEAALRAIAALTAERGRCVVKHIHGCGGRGVYSVEPAGGDRWRVTRAYDGAESEHDGAGLAALALGARGRCLVMRHLAGIADGEHRYYYVRDRVFDRCLLKRGSEGFSVSRSLGGTREMVGLAHAEAREWPAIIAATLGLTALPALWTADIIDDESGRPVLSETNVVNIGLRPVPRQLVDEFVRELLE